MAAETQIEGRELDRLIALEVFGLVQCTNPKAHPSENHYYDRFCVADADSPNDGGELHMYSEMYADMGDVLQRMQALEFSVSMQNPPLAPGDWFVSVHHRPTGKVSSASARTLPHAVSLAALAAVRSR